STSSTLLALRIKEREDKQQKWVPPPKQFGKLNTDGASRGNLRKAAMGGSGRTYDEKVTFMFVENLGTITNNVVE
ncbi:hypothetical protein KI387_023357, partial [Taxus chinensis]